ncbi:hypothetical protein NP493_2233g00001 [Ridgeia piscesae]|uniref:Uncharacterized protein n=1 Tax=Ridgeia piscesae TaxID=27915 RepID=A0AAD9N3U9_RIDPI|nr:hypothetical protein NP493_2233g00001 [Ridgeia piscesae]
MAQSKVAPSYQPTATDRRPGDLDNVEKRNCCNAYWRQPVVINSQVSIRAAAVSDWLRSVTCAERGQSPALRRTGRISGFGFPYGRTALISGFVLTSGLWASGLRPRLRSIRRNVTGFPPGPGPSAQNDLKMETVRLGHPKCHPH